MQVLREYQKTQRAWATYSHKNDKTFLKSAKFPKFTEVEHVLDGKSLRIVPVMNKLF